MAINFNFGKYLTGSFICFMLFASQNAFGQIKPQTMVQIRKLVAEKQSRTQEDRKVSSQLLQAVRESNGLPMTDGVSLKPANVNADASGNLEVDINATVSRELLDLIRSGGGKIIFSSPKFHSIRALVNLSTIKNISGYNGVKFIKPASQGHTVGGKTNAPMLQAGGSSGPVNTWQPARQGASRTAAKNREANVRRQLKEYMLTLGTGSVNSEGDHTMGADSARAKYGYEGQGIRIGVMSDSYNALGGAAADVANGDLPGPGNPLGNTTPVTVVQDYLSSSLTDEGRAMLQIVHDVVPKAQLFFATAYYGQAGFASNILALRNAYNCDIIIDDVSYFDEPAFQDGIVAQAVNQVTADGAMYFSSAGNAGSLLTDYSSVWQGDFNSAGIGNGTIDGKTGTLHNFGTVAAPEIGDSVVTQGKQYVLTWSDPLGASANDYDLFIADANGNVVASSTNTQDGTSDPIEEIRASSFSPGYQVVVFKEASAQARAFRIILSLNGSGKGLKYGTAGQTFGHACAADGYSVAASPAAAAYPGVFSASSHVEFFSSDGLRRIFYNADSTPVTPGNFLFATNGGVDRKKPDITAADGVSTNVHNTTEFASFYGTSAAAPHAGAVAALLKSAKPSLTPAQIRTLLTSTALDIEAPGYDLNSGYGIIQAYKAMQQLNPAPLPSLQLGQVTAAEGSFSNHNGFIDPGEAASLTVQLLNGSMADAMGINAILSTSTPGVTIAQRAALYGNIAKGGSATNTGTPFSFVVSPSVPCGTVVTFFVSAAVGGGAVSPQGFSFNITVGSQKAVSINGQLGAKAPTGSSYTVVSGKQTGRLSRGTVAASCASPLPADTLLTATGLRQYDAYTFTNTSAYDQCVSVKVNSTNGLSIYTASYNSAGFIASNPALNFVADPGQSNTVMQYSFTAPAGKKFTIVVHDVPVLAVASGSSYTLNVSFSECEVTPPCTPVKLTKTSLVTGATGAYYSQVLPATGGSGVYQYIFSGGLPAGLFFAGDSLFGKPTQAGRFPITVTVNDLAGCPSTSQKDTLVIAGDLPSSVQAVKGTPQSTPTHQLFADTLKAKVFDAANKPLAGVNVVFTAPATGASCSFNAGLDTLTAVTDGTGTAWATVTANSTRGSYQATATVTGVTKQAGFALTNTCMATVVTSNGDDGPGTLRYIVANACPDATVTFAPAINKISLTSGDIKVGQGISLNGPGADKLVISGGGISRVFTIAAGDSSVVNITGVTIRDGVPQDTAADGGGGLLIYSGKTTVSNCVISNNDVSRAINAEGGGIDNQGGTLTVNNSVVFNNTAYYDGGGIAVGAGSANINGSTISGNTATQTALSPYNGGWGGGIFTAQALSLNNCTIYGNTAQAGANLMGLFNAVTFTTTMRNCIVAGGILTPGVTGAGPDIFGQGFETAGFNLVQDTATGAIPAFTASDIIGANPQLLPLANYGGATPTLLPMPNSPVINKGDSTLTAAQFDQRGYTRVAAGRADIGAFEANYNVSANAGTPQSAAINKTFAAVLKAKVRESGNAVGGVRVAFTAPATGASGTFTGGSATATQATGADGIATAPAFTANGNTGAYTVKAGVGDVFASAAFGLTNTNALSVTFGGITATAGNCKVQVSWQTLTGQAGETYTVEHSVNGFDFTPLYTTSNVTNSGAVQTYNYTDAAPVAGTNYYRIKQTDAGGYIIYSHVVTAVNTCSGITAYPNPVHNILTLVIPGQEKQAVNIYDATGRVVAHYTAVTGTLTINTTGWAQGVYTAAVIKEGKPVFTVKLVKE